MSGLVGNPEDRFSHYEAHIKTAEEIVEDLKLSSCSTQLSMNFILLMNAKMPTIVCILTFMSRINEWLR